MTKRDNYQARIDYSSYWMVTDCDSGRCVTVTETVTEEKATEEETQKLLKKVVSRLGLEPRALALKAPTQVRKINTMILLNRPMSDKYLQRVTIGVSYIGHAFVSKFSSVNEGNAPFARAAGRDSKPYSVSLPLYPAILKKAGQ